MSLVPRWFSALGAALIAAALLNACGGSHGAGPAALPALIGGDAAAGVRTAAVSAAASAAVVAINAGGSVAGNFAADEDFVAAGTGTTKIANPIDTSAVTNPAPQAVYQSERRGPAVAYTIPGLIAGAAYTVRLHFAEVYWKAAGKRVFNVSINNTEVLTSFDIFAAAAGARFKAVAESFSATASSGGTIAVKLTAVTDNAAISGIEIAPAAGPTPTPAATPTPPPAGGFNDYTTFGYDIGRDVFNPNSAAITPASVANIHLAWQKSLGDYNTQTQPVLATEIPGHAGVLFVGGGSGNVYAYDALTGSELWTRGLGQEQYKCGSSGTAFFGVGGSAAYDSSSKSLYVVGNSNASPDAFANNSLYHLDAATGAVLGKVDFAPSAAGPSEINFSHTSVTLNNGIAYIGTGSTCDISSWRGRVVAVAVPAMTIVNTFFTLWDPNNARGAGAQPWGGGGIWGWGGVSLDSSGNVLTGVGNADNNSPSKIKSPFATAPHEYSGYAETLLELTPNVATAIASNHPIAASLYGGNSVDLDVQGTPLVFRPNGTGCATMVALQAKSGELTVYDETRLSAGPVAQYRMGPSNYDDSYIGDPAYSPATGLVYADAASSTSPSLFPPGLIAINPGCGSPSVAWHAAFGADSGPSGTPRSVPAASAGGVVFAGSVNGGGDFWVVNASTGALLNGGKPILHTSGNLRVPPTIDGNWIFVLDDNGDLYGLTIDPKFAAITARYHAPDSRQRTQWRAQL